MEKFNIFWEELMQNKLVESAIVILASLLIYTIVHRIIVRSEKRAHGLKNLGRSRTYIRLILSIVRYVFIIITILTLLQVNGVDVSSILAGLGLAGVIVGLAVQDALKDIIRGFSIVSDHYFSVGDVIKYNDQQEGTVLEIGLRSTKLKSITNGCTVTIANRTIEKVEQCSNATSIRLPLPYELSITKAEAIIAEIIAELEQDELVTSATYLGITELSSSSIDYLISMKTKSEYRRKVRRMAYRTALLVLEKHNISVPYEQLDIHSKK